MLGSHLLELFGEEGVGFDLPEFDVTDRSSVHACVNSIKPDLIVNTSAITDVDYCEENPAQAEEVHHTGVRNLASTGVRLVTISTDQVFSRAASGYLFESSTPEPANVYAFSKLRGEAAALEYPGNVVVRTSWLFGDEGLLPWIIRKLLTEGSVTAVTDQTSCLTSVDSLAEILVNMTVRRDWHGLYHCVNTGAVTPYKLACIVRDRIGEGRVEATEWKQLALPAPRPVWSPLGTEREIELPSLEEVMDICLKKML